MVDFVKAKRECDGGEEDDHGDIDLLGLEELLNGAAIALGGAVGMGGMRAKDTCHIQDSGYRGVHLRQRLRTVRAILLRGLFCCGFCWGRRPT